jgi:hypothetical protein
MRSIAAWRCIICISEKTRAKLMCTARCRAADGVRPIPRLAVLGTAETSGCAIGA